MTQFIAFLALGAFGQLVLFFLARLFLVPFAKRLMKRGRISAFAATDITVTLPLLLQVVWVAITIAWLMQ